MRRLPAPSWRLPLGLLAALPLLGIARLMPADGSFGLWLRLLAATAVLLLPGALIARALGQRGAAPTLAWSLLAIAAGLALTFAVDGSLALTLGVVGGIGLVVLPWSGRRDETADRLPARTLVLVSGLAFGVALWHVAGIVHGDGLFHLARVRKLDTFGSLSLHAVDEFKDGGLHPGYAFPLWHAFLALVARIGGVDPSSVVLHEPSALAPVAFLAIYEAGGRVFRSAWLAGAALVASVALFALAAGGGGAFATLAGPGTAARQLLVPALVAIFFAFLAGPSWTLAASLAAVSVDLAFVHPTYALFAWIPLAGFVVVRVAFVRRDARAGIAALAAIGVPSALVFLWLRPLVDQTASHAPSAVEKARGLKLYASELVVSSSSSYHLRPEVFARTGAVAVAALVLVPLAVLAARRRWAALVVGGALVVLALELSSLLFPRFADAVSLSQARRAAGFLPFAFAFAGGLAVLARISRWALPPAALAAGIVLQHRYPGDFGRGLGSGSPALPAWIALGGAAVAVVLGIALARRRPPLDQRGWMAFLAALLFVVPVAVSGFRDWQPRVVHDGHALTPGLVEALRNHVPKRDVVYADLETSYRIAAALPVYVANSPPSHVADTKANDPYGRRRAWLRFLRTGELAIPRRAGAHWLVLTRHELRRPSLHSLGLPRVYADPSFVLFRLASA